MNLVIIFGPHAVGKMTVGQELAKLTKIPLFHNHVSIELALSLLGQDQDWQALSNEIREVVFKHVSNAKDKGLIFTFMWALDYEEDYNYIQKLTSMFKSQGGSVFFVELYADKEIRIQRNQTENRLREKPSKQDLEISLKRFLQAEEKYRLNSYENELKLENYLKIDNTDLKPDVVAKMIKDHFHL